MKEIIESFDLSLKRLEEVILEEESIIVRDAAIQRFEFTMELSWKSVQKFLRTEAIICRSPKQCLKDAFSFGLIEDDKKWIQMIEDRNLTAHTYNEETAQEVFKRLPLYLPLFRQLFRSLQEKLED